MIQCKDIRIDEKVVGMIFVIKESFGKYIGVILGVVLFLAGMPLSGQVAERQPQQLEGVGVEEHLGDTIPLDLEFTDHFGQPVKLKNYFHRGKPVVLVLSYYNCPMLCPMVLSGIAQTADSLSWAPGSEYQILTVSIDPKETVQLAKTEHDRYAGGMKTPVGPRGWVFHVGTEENIKKLADAVGFQYKYLKDKQQYAHPAVYFVLSENGKITRYLYGIHQKRQTLRLALVEASHGKIGNTIDKVLLYCCQYDPSTGTYVTAANRVMNLVALSTALVLGTFLGGIWWREKRKKARA